MGLKEQCNRVIQVRNRTIGGGSKIFLTAEIGAAHDGSVTNAKILIKAAADAGCDGADIFMASPYDFYWRTDEFPNEELFAPWERLAFTDEDWVELLDYSKEQDIILYPTPLDIPSLHRCKKLGFEMFNVNSDDANNYFYLKEAAKLGLPMTMHDINISLAELMMSVDTLLRNGAKDIILLHSTQESGEEATLYASANLQVINTYRQFFGARGVLAGCVEHTTSDFLIYAVAALNPVLISKHIQLKGVNNKADETISVDSENLSRMVRNVRYVEQAIGGGANQLVVDQNEKTSKWNCLRRKVIVAANDIPQGKVIEESDLVAKRPGHHGGVSPLEYIRLIGSTAKTNINKDTPIEFSMFENIQSAPYKYPPMDPYIVNVDLDTIKGA